MYYIIIDTRTIRGPHLWAFVTAKAVLLAIGRSVSNFLIYYV